VSPPDIDAFQYHRQLFSVNIRESILAEGWPGKTIFFEPLDPEAKAILPPVEDLYCTFCLSTEYEYVSTGWILACFFGETCQAITLLSHISERDTCVNCRVMFDIHCPPPLSSFGGFFSFS
jgi:hypothetical protein